MHDAPLTPLDIAPLFESVGVVLTTELLRVRVRGDDARAWLNGQLTNDVSKLAPTETVLGLFLSPKGRILAEAIAFVDELSLGVFVPASSWPDLRAHLEKYIIMEDVELVPEGPIAALFACGPRASELAPHLPTPLTFDALRTSPDAPAEGLLAALPSGEVDAALPAIDAAARALGGGLVSTRAFEVARARVGRPRFGIDFGDTSYPHEAGLERLAVSFKKGCYLGQEVVCMLESRGQLSRRLVRLESDAPLTAGTRLSDATGTELGSVTSAALDPATGHTLGLGYVKRAFTDAGTTLVARAGDVPGAQVCVLGAAMAPT